MTDHEFKHWLALDCMRVIGYQSDALKIARIERRIAISFSNNASKNLADYYCDPFAYTDEEDEEFQEVKIEAEKTLEERKAAGEFDSETMREFARKHAEQKRLENGN